MSRREKVAPEGAELKVMRMLNNGYPVRVLNGKITVGTTVPVEPAVLDSLVKKNWVTFQKEVEFHTRIYVSTKRGREALALAPEIEIASPVFEPDPRFGVVVKR
jgi:predicted secreted Zn-dependent protease